MIYCCFCKKYTAVFAKKNITLVKIIKKVIVTFNVIHFSLDCSQFLEHIVLVCYFAKFSQNNYFVLNFRLAFVRFQVGTDYALYSYQEIDMQFWVPRREPSKFLIQDPLPFRKKSKLTTRKYGPWIYYLINADSSRQARINP